ncbi:DUF3291 domain-containing protein [Vibrio vulnificus]|nr:DUF3291 domain-containing protein [Vibrio vulnificus]MCJ0812043.1 DUF3291 domain-containing protein [Vibrio vulnificus]MCR9703047.1 DUF3291 domain-containing protein [Vibrio vulnificus]
MKLAQLNIALAKYPLDAPEIKEFVDNGDTPFAFTFKTNFTEADLA